MTGGYAPGYGRRTARMLEGRRAAERLAFLPSALLAGARVLDAGCGPGALTAGLAERVGPAGALVALDVAADHLPRAVAALTRPGMPRRAVVRGSVTALPMADGTLDVVVAHAVLEHLTAPADALAEMRRVLRAGGTLAVVDADWSGARVGQGSPHARRAIEGYRLVRARAGTDADAGASLAGWVRAAGFAVRRHRAFHRRDMAGPDLAAYLGERMVGDGPELDAARDAARRWAAERAPATVDQRWVEVLAVRE